jgi:hypothetical protein
MDIHFGKNPSKGGSPPRDISIISKGLLFFIETIDVIFWFDRYNAIWVIINEYTIMYK